MARHAGRSKPGSKPVQLYVRLCFRPLVHKENFKVFLFLETAAAAFVYISYTLSATRVLNSFEVKLRLKIDLVSFPARAEGLVKIYIYIYIYMCVHVYIICIMPFMSTNMYVNFQSYIDLNILKCTCAYVPIYFDNTSMSIMNGVSISSDYDILCETSVALQF